MMDHARYRSTVLADPHACDADLLRHRDSCGECREFTARLLRFESRLQRALRVDLPSGAVNPFESAAAVHRGAVGGVAVHSTAGAGRWLALAASLLVAAAGGLWLVLPGRTLAAAAVDHMAGEPQAWARTDVAVPGPALDAVLGSGLRLAPAAGLVSYASSCVFRGHRVPHLVVQTAAGPVTVMILLHENVDAVSRFESQGYRGTIVPVPGHGSMAVLSQAGSQSGGYRTMTAIEIDRLAARLRDSIIWTS
jgi:hypothetical protein